jgi:hypothetical protein
MSFTAARNRRHNTTGERERERERESKMGNFRTDAASEHEYKDTNRHVVEVPDSFAIARWSRDADAKTIARCILATLKYEPHTADITMLRRALEAVIEHKGKAAA